jgi:hypothetical protein
MPAGNHFQNILKTFESAISEVSELGILADGVAPIRLNYIFDNKPFQ